MKLDRLKKNIQSNADISSQNANISSIDLNNIYVNKDCVISDLNDGGRSFLKILKEFNSNPALLEVMKMAFKQVELNVAKWNNIYTEDIVTQDGQNIDGKRHLKTVLVDRFNAANKAIKILLDLEASTPYGLLYYILDGDFSDIMIHMDGIKVSDNMEVRDIKIPEELREIYYIVVDHFIDITTKTSKSKLDTGNAILDAENNVGSIGVVRYNIVHGSLNGRRNRPIIIIRKQTTKSIELGQKYLDSLGLTDKQQLELKKIGMSGSTIIFGETGSGKTTLMKYLAGYKLENKRNLITIEDTAELNLPVPIALTTNSRYGIKELFTAALRQNPSGIVIGESRDDTIIDILEASLSTKFAMSTIHANSLPRAIQRIVSMSLARNIPREDVENLIKVSVSNFIYIENRKVMGIWRNNQDVSKSVYEVFERIE